MKSSKPPYVAVAEPPPTLCLLAHQASALKDDFAIKLFPLFLEHIKCGEAGIEFAATEAYRAAHALMVERARRANR